MLPLFLLFSSVAFSADDIGFSHGSMMNSVPVSGRVTVFCPASIVNPTSVTVSYSCQDVILEPAPYDYFIGPKGQDADHLTLLATREDGSVRSKTDLYDGTQTRSSSALNLWISTLFQRPLLKKGLNRIDYTLVLDKAVVGQGKFQVLVQELPGRECPVSQYVSADPADCNSPFSVCERYFSQYNNCTLK